MVLFSKHLFMFENIYVSCYRVFFVGTKAQDELNPLKSLV